MVGDLVFMSLHLTTVSMSRVFLLLVQRGDTMDVEANDFLVWCVDRSMDCLSLGTLFRRVTGIYPGTLAGRYPRCSL